MNSTTPFHILIVEDSPEDRAEFRRMLLRGSSREYRFTEAASGAAGVRACLAVPGSPPDCVLLDYHLPDMDATEVLAAFRAGTELPPCPVVILTGSGSHIGSLMLRGGAQDYIGKAWSTPESLTRAIENSVERFAMVVEHKRTEKKLRESEQALRESVGQERARREEVEALMDAIPAAVFISQDPACQQMTGNRATVELLGLPHGSPLQIAPGTARPGFEVWTQGQPLGAEEMPMQRASATGRAVSSVEMEFVFPNGKRRDVFGGALPLFDEMGLVRGCVGAFMDITERKQLDEALRVSEERLTRAQRAARVGTWDWDLRSGTTSWTDEAWTVFGRTAGAFTANYDNWLLCVHPEDRASAVSAIEVARQSGRYHSEYRVLDPDGTVRWVESRGEFVADDRGEPVRMLGTVLDITERKNAELALRDAALRKDEFLAMLGHELRNPLTAIRHAIQIVQESPADASTTAWVSEVIDRQSRQLARMVEDLLDVARINRGRIELRLEPLELAHVFDRAIASIRPLLESRAHSFSRENTHGDLRIMGDEARLEQVFTNLLNNAAKYTPQGGRIHLAVRRLRAEAIISITDNGVGIAADLLPHVFDLFCQADSTLDRAQGGLGIGLTVVKSLVEMHGGVVSVESGGAGAGTTFTVRLPLLTEPVSPPSAVVEPPKRAAFPRAIRVLVVDDHVDAAEALARLLILRNCDVRIAHDGTQGLIVAHEFRPEVFLLDLGLPGLDGYALARTLRTDSAVASSLFIAISGYAQDGDRALSLAAGFDEHCAKPVDFSFLISAVQARFFN